MDNYGYLYNLYTPDGQVDDFIFHKQFVTSYKSLKEHVPQANVTLHTNVTFDNVYGIDNVIHDENIDKRLISKAHALLKSPYERTIFIDVDIFVHNDTINDIFHILDEFDYTACHGFGAPYQGNIYPDLNTGLLGVKHSPKVKSQLELWIKKYDEMYDEFGHNDQTSFRDHIFMNNKKSFYMLPPNFQHRWQHLCGYITNIVCTHNRSMNKDHVTTKTIESWSSVMIREIEKKMNTIQHQVRTVKNNVDMSRTVKHLSNKVNNIFNQLRELQ